MNFVRRTCSICVFLSLFASAKADAGLFDSLSKASSWWQQRSIGRVFAAVGLGAGEGEKDDGSGKKQASGEPGLCKVPQDPPVMRCEIGSGFVCVDTPEGGFADDTADIRGTIDRGGSVPAEIRIASQNEYTKRTVFVDTSKPATSGCWEGTYKGSFCIDAVGKFAAKVPMGDVGPYTISVAASRLSGESVEKKVRTSRVVAPKLSPDKVVFDPDIRSGKVDSNIVMVKVDLLGECSYCDFIGASTRGTTVSIENSIVDTGGNTRAVNCATAVEQGGQGKFTIGVPVWPGRNELTIKACNAASGGSCSTMDKIVFESTGVEERLVTISPPPMPIYDSREYPSIDWKFTLGGASCLELAFNREAPYEVCAGDDGTFTATLSPRSGINVATLLNKDDGSQFAWTFGWGEAVSPFDGDGSLNVDDALRLEMSSAELNGVVIPFINNFLASDELSEFIIKLALGSGGKKEAAALPAENERPIISIPKCEEAGGMGGMSLGIGGMPTFGRISLSNATLADGSMSLSIDVDGLTVQLDVGPDADGDGKPDKDPLPLVISFKKAKLHVVLESKKGEDGEATVLITSPDDDCDYKSDSYCKHLPAVLIPENFVGNATPWGSFFRCDMSKAGPAAKDACGSINSLDGQMGVVAEMVLDAINGYAYCGGSRLLTGLARDYATFPVSLGCSEGEGCEGLIRTMLPQIELPIGIRIGDGIDMSTGSIGVGVDLALGDEETFRSTPEIFRTNSSGMVIAADRAEGDGGIIGGGYDIGARLSLDAVNALLYALTATGDGRSSRGLLDFDIHEPFFKKLGFDFVKECDEFEPIPGIKDKLPALCYVRPRVMELLGQSLTKYDYFPPKQPLLMALRGSRALGPRISIATVDDVPVVRRDDKIASGTEDVPEGSIVEIAIGGMGLGFYALEVDAEKGTDKYGNLPIKLGQDGEPIIRSMRPSDPDAWNGPIASFDVTMLVAIEIGDIGVDPEDDLRSVIKIRVLADRTRLVLTPMEGMSSTTIPPGKLISNLAEQLMTAISQYQPKESAIALPIPKEVAIGADDSLISSLGLRTITFGEDGLSLRFDREPNSVDIAVKAVIEQVLHVKGKEVRFKLPD